MSKNLTTTRLILIAGLLLLLVILAFNAYRSFLFGEISINIESFDSKRIASNYLNLLDDSYIVSDSFTTLSLMDEPNEAHTYLVKALPDKFIGIVVFEDSRNLLSTDTEYDYSATYSRNPIIPSIPRSDWLHCSSNLMLTSNYLSIEMRDHNSTDNGQFFIDELDKIKNITFENDTVDGFLYQE